MSVSVFDRNKVGTADELTPVATKNNQRVYVGTKAAVDVAMKDGNIGNNSVVYITDDYDETNMVDSANYAVTAGTANKVIAGATDTKDNHLVMIKGIPAEGQTLTWSTEQNAFVPADLKPKKKVFVAENIPVNQRIFGYYMGQLEPGEEYIIYQNTTEDLGAFDFNGYQALPYDASKKIRPVEYDHYGLFHPKNAIWEGKLLYKRLDHYDDGTEYYKLKGTTLIMPKEEANWREGKYDFGYFIWETPYVPSRGEDQGGRVDCKGIKFWMQD